MAKHFRIAPNFDMTAKCGRLGVKESTAYRTQVTCQKCLKAMDREREGILNRISTYRAMLKVKRQMRLGLI